MKTTRRVSSATERDLKAIKAGERSLAKSIRDNEPLRVTRFHPDGRREVLFVPAQEIYGIHLKPLSAKELREFRIQSQMTQEQFARWLMVSIATVRNWEQKTGVPRGPALRLIREYVDAKKKPQFQ